MTRRQRTEVAAIKATMLEADAAAIAASADAASQAEAPTSAMADVAA